MNKDTINLIKDSASIAVNIAQMTILSLLTMGVSGLMESRRSDNRDFLGLD